jgi:hypothetical protein
MPDTQRFLVATALMRVLEQVSLAVIAPDLMTAIRLVLLASAWRSGAAR